MLNICALNTKKPVSRLLIPLKGNYDWSAIRGGRGLNQWWSRWYSAEYFRLCFKALHCVSGRRLCNGKFCFFYLLILMTNTINKYTYEKSTRVDCYNLNSYRRVSPINSCVNYESIDNRQLYSWSGYVAAKSSLPKAVVFVRDLKW